MNVKRRRLPPVTLMIGDAGGRQKQASGETAYTENINFMIKQLINKYKK